MKTQAICKSIFRSDTALEFEVGTFPYEKESLERMKEEIIVQCPLHPVSDLKFARSVDNKVPDRFQAFALAVQKKLMRCTAWKIKGLQQSLAGAV